MTVLRAKNGSHNIFIHQIWQSDYIQRQIKDNLGATINQVTNNDISRYIIPMPPIAEQRAIAEALSDVDGLIAALDKKIAKKRLLKQGAMCKLLSLSGRGKKWFNTKLGNVVNIRKGSMLTSDKFVAGNIPVIAGGKIPAGYHNVANRPANTITISASGASAGYVALYNKPIFATDCSTIEPCSTYDIHYIYHLLKYYQSEIFAMQTGGAQPHVHPSDLNELQILYAKDIEEQQAIATILSDMDKEIADLEAQRDKYRLLKSGMMQKLLTGQVRLKTE
jgi:type I restriction enzyme S subunit